MVGLSDFGQLLLPPGSQSPSFLQELNFDGIDFGVMPGEQYMMPDFFDPSIILPATTTTTTTTTTAATAVPDNNGEVYVDGISDVQDSATASASETSPPAPSVAAFSLNADSVGSSNVNQHIGQQQQYLGQMYSTPQIAVPQQMFLHRNSTSPQALSTATTPSSVSAPVTRTTAATTATESAVGRGTKRRPHRKSRTGCRTCKKRRVKCDEIHPRCGNCSHLGLTCSFQTAASMIENETAIARTGMGVGGPLRSCSSARSSGGPGVNPGGDNAGFTSLAANAILDSGTAAMFGLGMSSVSLNLEDLRLMHVYSTTVHQTITKMFESQPDIWQLTVPQLAFQHAALMHALLAFCGSYVVRQKHTDATLTDVIGERAVMHRTESLRILRNALQNPLGNEMADPSFFTAYFLLLDSIANAPTVAGATKDNTPTTHTSTQFLTATPWLHLVRGICCIVKSLWPIAPRSIINTILVDDFYDLPMPRSRLDYGAFVKDIGPYSIKKNFVLSAKDHFLPNTPMSRLKKASKEPDWLYDDEDDLADIYPLKSTSPYVIPCFMLSKFKSVAVVGRHRVMSLLCIALGLLDDRFYAKFHSDDAVAHRLIAEFYRVLKRFAKCNCDEVWWLENLADGLDIEIALRN
ncbi:hypothetical protein V1517DRAFT_322643 [Lipomyces orientalis]|uniref:Uncharacterized protein n=1 Tax=Lipomyces orientalis TaxID=1233043 RepID=A0ACC3TPV0_9ASCO